MLRKLVIFRHIEVFFKSHEQKINHFFKIAGIALLF